MIAPEPQLSFTESGSLGIGRSLLTGSAFVVALSAGEALESPEMTLPKGFGAVLVGVTLPFEVPSEASTVSRIEVDLDREREVSLEARERRVSGLRSWLDSLPDVPAVPAKSIKRSELY